MSQKVKRLPQAYTMILILDTLEAAHRIFLQPSENQLPKFADQGETQR